MIKELQQNGDMKQGGGKLRLRLFPEAEYGFVPEWTALDVLYEDDFVLVVNKPARMPVHPVDRRGTGSLANAVAAYYASTGQAVAVRHIHRLDADTTGPVLYAKNALAQTLLDQAMREKRIERVYLAVVHGVPAHERGTIDAPIGRDRHHAGRRRVSPTGEPAITHYETVRTWPNRNASMLRLRLETGRTHQIRVHLSHIGLPLFGDTMYGGKRSRRIQRQALHGESLSFPHPWTREMMRVAAPLPGDLDALTADLAN
jgi:23S rRNA pseudouridine1911/1915/1917 synthase